ncbi:hypothetical protein [uncultured Muribaculum sp.]|uniref:hypothetical protein n=1 Tax=uncultured Muribaculum sp. TaxID=1918613 RepID=UPI0025EDD933|nr:hypothetical protein [uncultured Muribaculum sp.]
MRIRNLLLPVFAIGAYTSAVSFAPPESKDIAKAIDRQITEYPASQLADVYKNFFQDYFGPGHLLANREQSLDYLRHEMTDTAIPWEGPLYEPTGAEGNFLRVNLSVVRDGYVPFDTYFDAFARSVEGIVPPSGEQWKMTWQRIDSVLATRRDTFADEASDREMIGYKLKSGDFVVHHSQRYNDAYHFHYRIFSREIFTREILPLLPK